jgi:AraC-like DNA-binding protein
VGNLAFLIGPLLYFYIKSLLDPNYSVQRKDWLHALPFPAAVICSFIILQHYNNFYILNYRGRLFFSAAILVQSLAYIIASFKILHSNGLTFKSFLSYIDNSKLAWMRFFISGYIVLWLIQFQLFVGWDVLGKPLWCPYTTSLYLLTAFLFFNGMVYIGLKKPETFHQSQKYQSSVLKKPDKERYQEKLTSLMSSEKPYLDSSLTLTEIAQKLEIHPIYVSQIINETLQQNFRDFVNKYRIEESKRLLTQKDQHLNILGIALDAGFNSKSAFNRAFKRHTGITPKEFKKQAS